MYTQFELFCNFSFLNEYITQDRHAHIMILTSEMASEVRRAILNLNFLRSSTLKLQALTLHTDVDVQRYADLATFDLCPFNRVSSQNKVSSADVSFAHLLTRSQNVVLSEDCYHQSDSWSSVDEMSHFISDLYVTWWPWPLFFWLTSK